ncbi:hypothetical protein J7384_04730 [Endozoicomonas sp. G2_1]|uniref:hypothetical protein n=1 Tax=Endozoicomonas sp. G2_1 TaxID=2821091 RepID=UPI001ADCBCA2|nr:hypothetical protein [Endozoicomonas sp. G2_1]MBO9489664.1 hypothetical protein [Endozoicomonas sp. G2_1]
MLLTFINKGRTHTCRQLLALFSTLALYSPMSNANKNFDWHGFIAQGLIQSSDSDFVNNDGDLSTELTEVGVNASYQLTPTLRATGQLAYINGGNRLSEGVKLDYLLLDWTAFNNLDWQVNFYLGRIKNNHWLYSSIRDVPVDRPSIVLPQSIYFDGFRDTAIGGDGAAMNVSYSDEKLGEFDFSVSSGPTELSSKQVMTLLGEFAQGELEHDDDRQASFYWQPSLSNWRFGVVGLDSKFTYLSEQQDIFVDGWLVVQRLMVNAIYQGENWEFSSELIQERLNQEGFFSSNFVIDVKGQGGFVQARYHISDRLRFLARYERYFGNKDDKDGSQIVALSGGRIPAYFGYQHDATIGLTFDVLDNLRLQIEQHWVQGTARLTPVVAPNVELNDSEFWQISAAQLIYWF